MLLKNFTLLFVEDDKGAQEQMKMLLEDDLKEFYQAFDGKEGLSVYEEKQPDIILTDIVLTSLNGLEMSKKIKQMNNEQPIIIMSAFDEKETLLEAINSGIDYFLPKPVDIDILYNRLNIIAQNLQNKIDAQKLRQKEIQMLHALAHYDTLTQVANRHLFSIKLDEAISRANRNNTTLALFFIDLDKFKKINDSYGHSAGDTVLRSVTKNITKTVRLEDTFARIGGDEFALIVENVNSQNETDTLAKKIIEAVSVPINFKEKSLHITCSIGISLYPNQSRSKEELLHLGDMAMYEAKKEQTSNFVYSSPNKKS